MKRSRSGRALNGGWIRNLVQNVVVPAAARAVTQRVFSRSSGTQTRTRRGKRKGRRGTFTQGTYHGKFKKSKKVEYSKFIKGSQGYTTEFGGTSSAKSTVYVGHAAAPYYVLKTSMAAVVIKLYNLAGIYPCSLQEKVQGTLAVAHTGADDIIRWQFTTNDGGAGIQTNEITVPVDGYFEDASRILADAMLPNGRPHKFVNFQLHRNGQLVASINAGNLILELDMKSKMSIQNQTYGASADDDQGDDVTNNPVLGKKYVNPKGSGFMQLQNTGTSQLLNTQLVGARQSGLINLPVASLNIDDQQIYHRPPLPSAFGRAVNACKVRLEPGAIKTSVWNYHKKMHFNTIMDILFPFLTGTTSTEEKQYIRIGKAAMYGFNKLVQTRPDASLSSQPIVIGFEISTSYRARVKAYKTPLPNTNVILT